MGEADSGRRGGLGLWAFRMLLVYVCILLTQPQNRFTFLWPLHIGNLSFIAATALHVISCLQERRPLIRMGPGTFLAVSLLGCAILSQFFGAYQTRPAWDSAWWDMILKNSLLLIMLEATLTHVERVWATQMVVMVATFYWLKAGLRLSAAGATYSGDRMMGAAIGLIENPNSLAYMMSFYLPLYLYAAEYSKKRWEQWGYLLLLAFGIFVVFKTGSRTGLVALVVLGAFILPRYLKRNPKAVILTAAAVLLIVPMTGEKNIRRFKTIPQSMASFFQGKKIAEDRPLTQDEQSAEERRMKNVHTWELIKRNPVLGAGLAPNEGLFPADLPLAKGQVHCEILAAGRQMGIPGMLLYVAFWVMMALGGHKARRGLVNWPAAGELGRIFQLQMLILIVGGSFCPLPWHPPMVVLAASASALGRLADEEAQRWGLAA